MSMFSDQRFYVYLEALHVHDRYMIGSDKWTRYSQYLGKLGYQCLSNVLRVYPDNSINLNVPGLRWN